mmetsp:Transcript_31161/g.76012  ORF Transcript_31161/g.76012 Transcript_31161/m.76012 type:complete len:271 (-) Transcript_31161:148-960(-)
MKVRGVEPLVKKGFSFKKTFFLIFATVIFYASSYVDMYVAFVVHWPKDYSSTLGFEEFFEKFGLTLLTTIFVFLPGVFQCFVDAYTYYHVEDAGKDIAEKQYPTIEYDYGCFRYPPSFVRVLLNITHARMFFEFIASLWIGRTTGGLRDGPTTKAAFQSFPQAVTQCLVWYFGKFGQFEELIILLSVVGSLLCIAVTPASTPCFKERFARYEPYEPFYYLYCCFITEEIDGMINEFESYTQDGAVSDNKELEGKGYPIRAGSSIALQQFG